MTRDNPLYWSFSLGVWFATRVRVSALFPLILIVLCLRLQDFQLGLFVAAVLFTAVLLHEFGHVVAARLTGGSGDEIVIWPLGGLALVSPANHMRSRLLTTAAGPLVNLALCLICSVSLVQTVPLAELLNPISLPAPSGSLVHQLMVVTFTVNWGLLLVNLIPVYPLDGGRLLETILTHTLGGERGVSVYLRAGTIAAILLVMAGLILEGPPGKFVLCVGSFVLVMGILETMRRQMHPEIEDSTFGYDFSQGYTSLNQGTRLDESDQKQSFFARWRQMRKVERQQREELRQAEVERQLDSILDKVHEQGLQSLTKDERSVLEQASSQYQKRRS